MGHAFLTVFRSVTLSERCTKRSYASLKEVRRAFGRGVGKRGIGLVSMGSGQLRFYRCRLCGNYHIGHK